MGIITCSNVTKKFGDFTALNSVSLDIPQGEIFGLLGPNGAGKTTLIRIINQITIPDAGQIIFDGHPMRESDIENIGYLPEERGLYKKMKVSDQAIYFARLKGLSRREATVRLKEWFIRFGIQDWWNKKVEDLSKGMAQKVQFIVTVLHQPELLIFDEPFSGFDPINANLMKQEILRLRDEGSTIIFSTHNMASVEEICDHITLINKSQNILSGRLDEVRHRHGNNIFEVDFRGEREALIAALDGHCTLLDDGTATEGIYKQVKIHVEDDSDVRSVISVINDSVELRSFREIIPSMNDIFIKAVAGQLKTVEEK